MLSRAVPSRAVPSRAGAQRASARTTPHAVTAVAMLALALLTLPVLALGTRVPWGDLGGILSAPETRDLLRITINSALLATAVALALGTPLALWLRGERHGAQLVRLLVLLPLALPPVVAGLALSAFIGRRGIAAPLLDALGWQFAFAFPGVVAAHVFIALPYVVVTLDSALGQLDREITDSAAAVGLTPSTITCRIILPAIAPALATAAGLAFTRSLGEFGTTLTFAGSMPGVTRTMPLGIYLAREVDQSEAYGLSAILVFLAVLVLGLSALPACLRRRPRPQVRATGPLDTGVLRELSLADTAPGPIEARGATFPARATTALIGPNGAGKSTLLRGLAGHGTVLLTQNPGLPPTSTPRKAVAMVTRDTARADALLRAAGLSELADVPVPALSGGQAAQVALVRALAARPGALLLDEPLASLDAETAQQWRTLLRAAAADRTTILVTHDPAEVAELCGSVAVMERGEVLAVRPLADEVAAPSTRFSGYFLAGLG